MIFLKELCVTLEPVVRIAKLSIFICGLPQDLPKFVYFVIASHWKWRGDPDTLDCFAAYAPRNDDPM